MPTKSQEGLHTTVFQTAWGKCFLAASKNGLVRSTIPGSRNKGRSTASAGLAGKSTILEKAKKQILEYVAHQRTQFDVLLDLRGTEFQKKAWNALTKIPHGQTRSYQDIARAIGHPKASRAVGSANHKNPLPLFVPCHRVIGKNGSLVGFGGGLALKRKLLRHEQNICVALQA